MHWQSVSPVQFYLCLTCPIWPLPSAPWSSPTATCTSCATCLRRKAWPWSRRGVLWAPWSRSRPRRNTRSSSPSSMGRTRTTGSTSRTWTSSSSPQQPRPPRGSSSRSWECWTPSTANDDVSWEGGKGRGGGAHCDQTADHESGGCPGQLTMMCLGRGRGGGKGRGRGGTLWSSSRSWEWWTPWTANDDVSWEGEEWGEGGAHCDQAADHESGGRPRQLTMMCHGRGRGRGGTLWSNSRSWEWWTPSTANDDVSWEGEREGEGEGGHIVIKQQIMRVVDALDS